jgi:protein-S-isoprenylcysteine O-methyltransferase Ste14
MKAIETIFAVGWAAFWIGWIVAAFSTKRARVPSTRRVGIRLVLLVAVIALFHTRTFSIHDVSTGPWRDGVGLVLFVLGLAFAIWARVHIGRNWGTPMTQKVEPELVTSGPYRLVRHPIYSGILAGGIGTAVALGWSWMIVVVIYGAFFIYSAGAEERYMTEQFPDAYPAYKRSSKMLVPFIF